MKVLLGAVYYPHFKAERLCHRYFADASKTSCLAQIDLTMVQCNPPDAATDIVLLTGGH